MQLVAWRAIRLAPPAALTPLAVFIGKRRRLRLHCLASEALAIVGKLAPLPPTPELKLPIQFPKTFHAAEGLTICASGNAAALPKATLSLEEGETSR